MTQPKYHIKEAQDKSTTIKKVHQRSTWGDRWQPKKHTKEAYDRSRIRCEGPAVTQSERVQFKGPRKVNAFNLRLLRVSAHPQQRVSADPQPSPAT